MINEDDDVTTTHEIENVASAYNKIAPVLSSPYT